MSYVVVSVALTTALWDAAARRALLDRAAAAARDAGALQVLDTTLWIMSLAELNGGTPRAAGRAHRRRCASCAAPSATTPSRWSTAPTSPGAVPPARRSRRSRMPDWRWGSPASTPRGSPPSPSATSPRATTATRYTRLKPLIDEPFLQVTPLELRRLRRGRGAGRARRPRPSPTCGASRSWRRPTGRRGPGRWRIAAGPS